MDELVSSSSFEKIGLPASSRKHSIYLKGTWKVAEGRRRKGKEKQAKGRRRGTNFQVYIK